MYLANPVSAAINPLLTRVAIDTNGYTVPSGVGVVRLVQTGTVASATITLPSAELDGYVIQIVNYAGAITALTLSPAVNGWTNGSQFAAFSGVRIRWDAIAATWYREQ